MNIDDLKLKCKRCDHEWLRRSLTKLPNACPKCTSPYWNKPRRKPSKKPMATYQRARRSGDKAGMERAYKRIKRALSKSKKSDE